MAGTKVKWGRIGGAWTHSNVGRHGVLASKLIDVLDNSGLGAATFEYLQSRTGASVLDIAEAVRCCKQLQRLEDCRVALVGYEEKDEQRYDWRRKQLESVPD